ncbi:protocadherin beta-18-like [Octopus sinensis]|uniref:Protocadherin beta-18-like n=1 Tax=Octopus sinensis TaxID=2607531 RepID=A0A6P7T3Q4_9MOLL|nr:protocadherin beta-18-like [Octopus sinensis]
MVTDTDSGLMDKLSSKEYKILVKEPLDREIRDHYKVSIVCPDMGSPQLESKKYFSVKVTDVNDVEPHFTKETFQFLTYENQKVDFPIGFINATDPDLGDGGQLTYSIINDNNNDNIPFQLTKYGFISTSQSIDREVKDIFEFQYVHYHPHSKKDITILKASDKDTGNNAFLTYGILRSNDKNLFTANSHTGVLSFSRTVYQNDAGTYELQFIVKDGGTPVQSATTAIILTLFVSNDTSPMLTAVPFQSGHDLNMTWDNYAQLLGIVKDRTINCYNCNWLTQHYCLVICGELILKVRVKREMSVKYCFCNSSVEISAYFLAPEFSKLRLLSVLICTPSLSAKPSAIFLVADLRRFGGTSIHLWYDDLTLNL